MIRTQVSILPSYIDAQTEFARWVIKYCDHTSIVLDVGAGKGITGCARIIHQKVAHLVGVDPDTAIEENPYLDERHQTSIEDFAYGRDSSFDCLYAHFVLEHLTRPYEFLSSCRSLLKPGGMLFGVTPNLWHYFGMATKLSASLGIEDWLLERLIGAPAKAAYHFPTTYRINSIQVMKRVLAHAGFQEIEFICFDAPKGFEYCLPKVLRWFPGLYSSVVYALRIPQIMGHIMFRATV